MGQKTVLRERFVENLESCDEIAKVLRTYIPGGCYTNFRDMLFHFRCLVNANEEFLDMMESYFECAKKYATNEFKEVIAYSGNLKENFRTIVKKAFESKENSELQIFRAFATYNDVADLVYEAAFDD